MSNSGRTTVMFWLTPIVGVLAGIIFLVGAWLGGHPGTGVVMLAITVVFSTAVVVASRRSETIRGLLDHRDERFITIDLRATALTGTVLILVVIGGAVAELARGHSGTPYIWLGAIAGLTYLAAIIIQRVRG